MDPLYQSEDCQRHPEGAYGDCRTLQATFRLSVPSRL